MNKTNRVVSGAIWSVVALLAALVVLPQLSAVQTFVGSKTARLLSEKLGSEVSIGRVSLGFPNRIVIDNVSIADQQHAPMLGASRVSAKIDLLPLVNNRIVITSAQLFGLRAALYQNVPGGDFNYQFALDSLASSNADSPSKLDLKIASLIIRHGDITFDRNYVPIDRNRLSPDHLHVSDLSAHIILNALQNDSLNLNLKRLSLKEASGLQVKNLRLKAQANRNHAGIENFLLEMPRSQIKIGQVSADYQMANGKLKDELLSINGSLDASQVALSDLAWLSPTLANHPEKLHLAATVAGKGSDWRVSNLSMATDNGSLALAADAQLSGSGSNRAWNTDIHQLNISRDGLQLLAEKGALPASVSETLGRIGYLTYSGALRGNALDNLMAQGVVTSDAGQLLLNVSKRGQHLTGHVAASDVHLRQILADNQFGTVAADVDFEGLLPTEGRPNDLKIKGNIARFDYKNYVYENLYVDATLQNGLLNGTIASNDKNALFDAKGSFNLSEAKPQAQFTAHIERLNPSVLNLSQQWPDCVFSLDADANLTGSSLNTINGYVDMSNFRMVSADRSFEISNLHVEAAHTPDGQRLTLDSDFGNAELQGSYDWRTFPQSFVNLIACTLPTLPGITHRKVDSHNNFSVRAEITDATWLRELFNVPVTLHAPMHLEGFMNDQSQQLSLSADMPHFTYNDHIYRNASATISTPLDTMRVHAVIDRISDNDRPLRLALDADAANNHLRTALHFENETEHYMSGTLNTDAQFFRSNSGGDAAHIDIHSSNIIIGDSLWQIEPGTIVYSDHDITVDHIALKHDRQHIIVDGRVTDLPTDTLTAELRDINVKYILDIVGFRSVDFSGMATGRAFLTNAFSSSPEATADLTVDQFRFQDGRMGVLTAQARLNNTDRQIDIHATANDIYEPSASTPIPLAEQASASYTTVNGYVSPQRSDIKLDIGAHNTRCEFLESFCGSFMRNVDLWATGDFCLSGPLKGINLTGEAVVDGSLGIKSLNTAYTLRNDTIRLIPDEIIFRDDTIYDAREHIGIVNGALYHRNLTDLSYNIRVDAQNLLAYDFRDFGSDTFCGTVYGTGDCEISGRSGEVTIDATVTPEEGSEIRYNAASPDAITGSEFITWHDRDDANAPLQTANPHVANWNLDDDSPTNIHLNFNINATPAATLKLIMDQTTGDYIALNGNGAIRATYFNKGAFDMFGNYNVDHGTYKLTIQNIIKKDFQFQPGGVIAFGGDPYNASLNLKALYVVNGVPLSDLNIGRSFTSNNIRVNCLMNIGGTPNQPHVDFALDMPTVGSDAKQMIFSLINSEEEMNQQVLYLLAVGRFYNQGANNAGETPSQQSQTSLAMQSLLSGTISQQLNNVLSTVVKNQNWNIGANISPGNQGFYNAEYEGLLSGRLLNNRLLINGQFGYRDNPNATTSFIGDFDIRYLLRPNGNLAIKVYNQTNDRYFTRNSLTTQGVGLILKKDFNGIGDLFHLNRNKK